MILPALLVYVAVFILSELLRPKPKIEDAKPAHLGDFSFPTATEGRFVPLVWGTVKLEGPNLIWYGDLKQKPIKIEIKTGLFSSEDQIVGYKYLLGMQFGLCRGGEDPVRCTRIWIADEEVFSGDVSSGDIDIDEPKLFGGTQLGSGGVVGTLEWFPGDEVQLPSTYLAPFQGAADAPAYRGTSHAVWKKGYVGTSTSIAAWAFEVRRIPTGLGVTNSTVNGGNDANPAHVIYEILTNTEWGMGLPSSDIDTDNFEDVAAILVGEGNGFSMVLDRQVEAQELVQLIEDQIEGKVFLNQQSGQWQIRLARNDYVPGDLTLFDEANVRAVEDYSAGSWSQTTNHVVVEYADRGDEYKETTAQGQDGANQRTQNQVVPTRLNYPGVKDATLANNIAWRELRSLSTPLKKATLIVDRTAWDMLPLSVLKWSNAQQGIEELPMRVLDVSLGELRSNVVRLRVVQDVFAFLEPSGADPFGTGWTPPTDVLVAIPADEQVAIEAPRAFLTRDPALPAGGEIADKIWAGARAQLNEAAFGILERHDPVTPSGAFSTAGKIFGPFLIGKLAADLAPEENTSTFTLTPDPDTQDEILDEFLSGLTQADLGVGLQHLLLIEDEFVLVTSASAAGPDVDLEDCWRGVLDSAQRFHAADTRVYLVFVAGALTDKIFPPGDVVHIKLTPESVSAELAEASATQITVDLDNRLRRPYPPAEASVNNTPYPSGSSSLDAAIGGGLTEDEKGLTLAYVRRDFRTTDEVKAAKDETSLPADFPAANSTEYEVEVRNDPDGLNTLLFTVAYGTAQNDHELSRTRILRFTNGVLPTRMRLEVNTQHLLDAVLWESLQSLLVDFDVASAQLAGKFNFTTLDESEVSASYTALATGTYSFEIGTDLLSSGALEARINGGSFVSVIASGGGTTGTLPGVTSGDTIEIRHTQGGADTTETIILMENPSSQLVAYGVLVA